MQKAEAIQQAQEQEAPVPATPQYVEGAESESGDENVIEGAGKVHTVANGFVFGSEFDEGIIEGGRE